MKLGAQFEISIDGTVRSHRDRQDYAIEAGGLLKQRHPQSQVVVRDTRTDQRTIIGPQANASYIAGKSKSL